MMTHPMLGQWTWIRNTNPLPWRVSTRGPDPRNELFKEDLSAELKRMFNDPVPVDFDVTLRFVFIRKLERRQQKADVTNLQKLTEDGLHGVLYKDDVQVRLIISEMLEQSKVCPEPAIGIWAEVYFPSGIKPAWDGGDGIWNDYIVERPETSWQPPDPNKYT